MNFIYVFILVSNLINFSLASNCFISHNDSKCDNLCCYSLVCVNKPYCCDLQWNNSCITESINVCLISSNCSFLTSYNCANYSNSSNSIDSDEITVPNITLPVPITFPVIENNSLPVINELILDNLTSSTSSYDNEQNDITSSSICLDNNLVIISIFLIYSIIIN